MRSESRCRRVAAIGAFTLAILLASDGWIAAQTVDEIESDEGLFDVEVVEIVPLSLGDKEMLGELQNSVMFFKAKLEDAAVRKAVAESDAKTAKMKAAEIVELSERWTKSASSASMVTAVVEAPCSDALRSLRDTFRQFGRMFVVDHAGVVVCASERTKRYSFAGEPWLSALLDPAATDGAMGKPVRSKTANREPQTPIMVPVTDADTGRHIGVGLALVDAVAGM